MAPRPKGPSSLPASPLRADRLTFREVDKRTWRDFERLFESKGAPKYCWCMAWRATPEEVRDTARGSRKRAIKKRVAAGTPIGILGYLQDEPVAWCSIAPRSSYRELGGLGDSDDPKVWSIVCFFVKRDVRGQGLGPQLVAAAIQTARKHGAKVVEAYPVAPDSPSYRFMGFVPMFAAARFKEVGRAGSRRHVMRRAVRATRG
jgi:GNAT superfamily N-acetyltransferase